MNTNQMRNDVVYCVATIEAGELVIAIKQANDEEARDVLAVLRGFRDHAEYVDYMYSIGMTV